MELWDRTLDRVGAQLDRVEAGERATVRQWLVCPRSDGAMPDRRGDLLERAVPQERPDRGPDGRHDIYGRKVRHGGFVTLLGIYKNILARGGKKEEARRPAAVLKGAKVAKNCWTILLGGSGPWAVKLSVDANRRPLSEGGRQTLLAWCTAQYYSVGRRFSSGWRAKTTALLIEEPTLTTQGSSEEPITECI